MGSVPCATLLPSKGEVLPNPGWTVGCSVEVSVLLLGTPTSYPNLFKVKLHEYLEGTQNQKTFFVELWDIGGSHSQRNARHVFFHSGGSRELHLQDQQLRTYHYSPPVHGIILVHDLANRKSCANLGRWLAEVILTLLTLTS